MKSSMRWLTLGRIYAVLAWCLLLAAAGSAAWQGMLWHRAVRDTHVVKMLRARENVMPAANAAPEVFAARGLYLVAMGKLEDARAMLEQMRQAPPPLRALLSYDIGNATMRRAIDEIQDGALEKAIPLVSAAKLDYRRALADDPSNWDMKFNLDVAMRMVRDFPATEQEEGDTLPASKKLWPNMPGQPQGLP